MSTERAEGVRWHRSGEYEARINREWLDGPLVEVDFTTGVQVRVRHESGRLAFYKVHADEKEPAVIECWMEDGEETFLHDDVISAITSCLSVATMPVIEWDGR